MTDPVLIPVWLYERAKASLGSDTVDRIMAEYNAIAVGDWEDYVDLRAVKEGLNNGR